MDTLKKSVDDQDISAFVENRLQFCAPDDWIHTIKETGAFRSTDCKRGLLVTYHCAISDNIHKSTWPWEKISEMRQFNGLNVTKCNGCGRAFSIDPPSSGFAAARALEQATKQLAVKIDIMRQQMTTTLDTNHKELMARLESVQNVADLVDAFTQERNANGSILTEKE